MILDRHWWKTADGRLVPDGDPDARILAYPRGHEVADHLARQVGLLAAVEAEQAEVKQAQPAEDKMVRKPSDKPAKRPPASGPGSGLDAWRVHAAEVTGRPVEDFADLTRDEIIKLLDG